MIIIATSSDLPVLELVYKLLCAYQVLANRGSNSILIATSSGLPDPELVYKLLCAYQVLANRGPTSRLVDEASLPWLFHMVNW